MSKYGCEFECNRDHSVDVSSEDRNDPTFGVMQFNYYRNRRADESRGDYVVRWICYECRPDLMKEDND